jgi:hypothetical protein
MRVCSSEADSARSCHAAPKFAALAATTARSSP